MARAVKATRTTKPVSKAPSTRSVPAAKRAPAAAASAPKLGKEELRAQVEKLERANATLRAKSKQAGQSAKAAAARVAELEAQVEQFEQAAAAAKAPAKAAVRKGDSAKPVSAGSQATPKRTRRRKSEIDPGDAVPPGLAVSEPLPMDEEAAAAKENLEEHLRGEQP